MPSPAKRARSIDGSFEAFFTPPPEGTIRLTLGEPDFATPRAIVERAKQSLDAGDTHYVPTAGKRALVEAVAAKLKRENGLDYDPSCITVTVGAKEGILDAALALLDPGDELLIPAPCWHSYGAIATIAGARDVPAPTRDDNFHPDLEALKAAVTPRTKAILVNSPNNPTGAVYEKHELQAIVDLAVDRDLYLISDEIYEHLVYGGRRHHAVASLSGAFDRTVTVNGFSKAFAMTGWRMGYTAAPPELAKLMRRIHMHTVTHPSSFQHDAAVVALTQCGADVRAMVEEYERRRQVVHAALAGVAGWKCAEPEGAFYAFPDIRGTGLTSAAVYEKLLAAGVQVIPGHLFPRGEGFLRVSYAAQVSLLKTAGQRIRQVFPV
jgi:aspartate aminotransferase